MIFKQISEILLKIPITSLAFEKRFCIQSTSKINPVDFILSFFSVMKKFDYFSFKNWAMDLSIRMENTITPNAIKKRLSFRHIDFLRAFLVFVIKVSSFTFIKSQAFDSTLLSKFNKILVVDSTYFSMPKILINLLPGPFSKYGPCATAKLQLTLELKNEKVESLDVSSFRLNDQSYADAIFRIAKKGDLILRDLGYLVVDNLVKMSSNGINYISKIKKNYGIYDDKGFKINLLSRLDDVTSNTISNSVDWIVYITKKKIKVRLVATKVPDKVFKRRVNKARKDRHSNTNHSLEYYELLRYSIFITNIESAILTPKEIHDYYSLRWRIEVLFKCWKSHLNMDKLFLNQKFSNPFEPLCIFYLALAQAVIFHNFYFHNAKVKTSSTSSYSSISILKFYKVFADFNYELLNCSDGNFLKKFFNYFCSSTIKNKGPSYEKTLYMLNSS